jgi:large subunit ribosomal protein L29
MYADDIRKMTDEQVLNAIEDGKEALFNLRFQQASGQLEDVNALTRTRRDIARLKTVLRERQLASAHVSDEGKK